MLKINCARIKRLRVPRRSLTNAYKKQSAAQDLSIGRRMALLLIPKVAAGAGSTHTMDAIQADDAALGLRTKKSSQQSRLQPQR
jgi:hypothetical protein